MFALRLQNHGRHRDKDCSTKFVFDAALPPKHCDVGVQYNNGHENSLWFLMISSQLHYTTVALCLESTVDRSRNK